MNLKEKHTRFISSPWWKEIRADKIDQEGFCFICHGEEYLQVHHAGYKNMWKGRPRQALKGTFVLCRSCHFTVHKIQKSRGWTYEKTRSIIKSLAIKARKLEAQIKILESRFQYCLDKEDL